MAKITYTQKYNPDTFSEEIDALYPKADFEKNSQKALKEIQKQTTAAGFRKGSVPENIVLAQSFHQINDRAIEISLNDTLKELGVLNPKPLDSLNILSVSLAGENGADGLQIKMSYLPFPIVELGDYTRLGAKRGEAKKATEKEVEEEIGNVWFFYAKKTNQDVKKEDFTKEKVDIDFIQNSGIAQDNPDIKDYDSLFTFIESYINSTHEQESQIDWENQLKQEIVDATTFEKVEGAVEGELQRRVEDYLKKFKDIGMDPEEYLKKNNVNLDDLKKEWKAQSDLDIKFELALQEYGRQKGFKPTEEEINFEISKLDPETRKMYNSAGQDRLRIMITYYYINSKAFRDIADSLRTVDEATEEKPKKSKKK